MVTCTTCIFTVQLRKMKRKKRSKMLEKGMCLALIVILLGLYGIFGKLAAGILKIQPGSGVCLLFGVFVYHGLFQIIALPLILLKQPLSLLAGIWFVVLALILLVYFFGLRLYPQLGWKVPEKVQHPTMVTVIMVLLVLLQAYYMITSEYMGWDTSFYAGTVATSVDRNSMYLINGENGNKYGRIPFRYALSSFYMHAAVWCQPLRIMAINYTKIVQGGVLAILSNLAVYEIGKFLFAGKQYENIVKKERVSDCAAGVVIAVVILHVFWDTIYSTSDFLLQRGMEAKAYCANMVLPCIFLFAVMLWRERENRTYWICLCVACWSSVAISMSSLVIVPAMVGILLLPLLSRKKFFGWCGRYLLCILPNLLYLLLYLLDKLKIIGIEV